MTLFTASLIIVVLEYTYSFPTKPFYADEPTLKLVHVIFRHGDRTPDQISLYPSNPFYNESNYRPYGYGQLINKGKRREYHIGTALRKRYNRFLGNVWDIDLLDVRSTDYNRTKMSAQLMLAGLFPPTSINIWDSSLADWQPIPYNYEKVNQDKELTPFIGCTRFLSLYNELLATPEISSYLNLNYNKTLNILADKTGIKMSYLEAFYLYFGFLIQEQLNLPLEEWTKEVYPEPLKALSVDFYYLQTNTTELRKIISGYLLKKIITDTQKKIDATLNPSNKKLFVYSAHETNVATILLALEAFKIADIPPYGSYVLFEVHQVDGIYGLKLFYENYSTSEPKLLKIPGCSYFCPFNEFINLVEEILPNSDAECYGNPRYINEL